MACGATLKRHREFDPLQQSSPDLSSPKRICLTPGPAVAADRLMSPSVPVTADRLLAAPSTGTPAAAMTMTHSRLQQLGGSAFVEAAQKLIQARMSPHQREKLVDSSNNQMQSASGALPPAVYQPWVGDQLPDVSQPWQGSASSTAASGRTPVKKEQLFSMRQVEVICRNVLKEHEESVRGEFDNILTNKLAEQYECLLRFNQAQIHSRFDNSDARYVS